MIDNPKPPQTILVTGGAGFIGSNFIGYWLKQHPEDRIVNLDALTYAGTLENTRSFESNPNYTFIHGSICDLEIVKEAMARVDLVVHFAAESHVDRSILNPGVFVETNVLGTQTLLAAALEQKVTRFHHISTDEVFGTLDPNSGEKFSETTPYDPRSPYSASKAGSDHLVRAYGETYGLPYTISNCSNNYGPNQFPEKFTALAITNLIDNKPIPIYGDGGQIRDWLYVLDHCTAVEAILLGDKVNTTFVVGGLTADVTNKEIASSLLSIMGKPPNMLETVTDRPGHDRKYSVDWSHINETYGWKPSVTLEEGLAQTVAWYEANEAWWRPLKEKNSEYFQTQYNTK